MPIISAKRSATDIWQDSKCASDKGAVNAEGKWTAIQWNL